MCSFYNKLLKITLLGGELFMNFILWIVLGAIAGWIASMIMKTDANQGMLSDIILGIVGAVIGGYLMNFFGQNGVDGFNFYSLFVAIIGSMVVLGIKRAFTR
jgi:uncharacterized membrane protein YeaQ/YmgE (transglycosylase-associated protein family)